MRVIAGEFRGRLLKTPKGLKIRPTSEKVKQALFNILGQRVSGAQFLELFAGTGSIGIEARSRGAETITFVENNRLCLRTIEENLRHLGIRSSHGLKGLNLEKEASALLLAFDAEEAIQALYQKKQKFDFIFLDPHYYQDKPRPCTQERDKLKNCLIKMCRYDILKPRSLVIAEHNKKQILPQQLPALRIMFTKTYGDAALSFYQKEG